MQDAFTEWVEKHSLTFGLRSEDAISGMLAWREVFEAAHYSASELHEATMALAQDAGFLGHARDKWAKELPLHLSAITDHIRGRRAVLYREENNEHEWGTCTQCGSTGRVVVPHLAGIKDGEWVPVQVARGGASYYTMAVLCHCARGRWVSQRIADPKKRPMTLQEYSARNTGWPGQLAARQREQAARAWLEAKPGEKADWRALQKRLAEQFSM